MTDSLRISLIQTRVHWHDPAQNRAHFQQRIEPLAGATDVIVLTETFTSGFTRHPQEIGETMQGETVAWMREQAAATGAAITGSVAMGVDGHYYNRLLWVNPDGTLHHYDKRHRFGLGGEHERYSAGNQRVVFEHRGWRVCPQVCYDLRFPVWTRSLNDYDLLLFVANWPLARAQAWRVLLRARAIENQCYVVGVNRVGRDGNDLEYAGDSAAIDCLGNYLVELHGRDAVETVTIEKGPMDQFREQYPFWRDADKFQIFT